jgi:hypothetical protein
MVGFVLRMVLQHDSIEQNGSTAILQFIGIRQNGRTTMYSIMVVFRNMVVLQFVYFVGTLLELC